MTTNDPSHTPTPTASPFSRRSLLASLVAVPLLAVVAAACGDRDAEPASTTPDSTGDSSGSPRGATTSVPPATDAASLIQHPTGAGDVVIRLAYEGGFVPQGTAFVNMPTLLVSGDGKAYTPGVTTMQFPGPMVLPMSVRTITDTGIQTLLAAAQTAGLLAPPPDYTAASNVADAPDTVVTLQAAGSTFVHSAYALGFGSDAPDNAGPESTPARVALHEFTTLLGDLGAAVGADQLGEESVFVPTEYRLQATPVVEADLAGIDPAPTIVDWPESTGVQLSTAAECARVPAADVGSVFADATGTTYFRQGDTMYQVVATGVLPGDPPC